MSLNWFNKIIKEHPKFWETYLTYFEENQPAFGTIEFNKL